MKFNIFLASFWTIVVVLMGFLLERLFSIAGPFIGASVIMVFLFLLVSAVRVFIDILGEDEP